MILRQYVTNGFNDVTIHQSLKEMEEEVIDEKLSEEPNVIKAYKVLEGFVDQSRPRRIPVALKNLLKSNEVGVQAEKTRDYWSAECYGNPDEYFMMVLLE